MKKLFFFISFLSLSAWADRKCTFQGKDFDPFKLPNGGNFSGQVKCQNENISQQITYKNGRVIEESFDGPQRKEIKRYSEESPNQWQHGEQIEYFPNTNKIKNKGNYEKMHKVGLQESFYESGQIREQKFFTHEKDRSSEETASIGFHQNGQVQSLRCASEKKNTINPKLCGFEGKSAVQIYGNDGQTTARKVTYVQGQLVEEEIPGDKFSNRNSAVLIGMLKDVKPKTVKIASEGKSKKYTYLYENGKVQREFSFNEQNQISGDDKEFFQNEKPARKTIFSKGEVTSSECWWENGKPRGQYKKTNDGAEVKMVWSNGVTRYDARYIESSTNSYGDRNELFTAALRCSDLDYDYARQGHFTEFNEAGKMIYDGTYEKGKETGWHKIYDENGIITEERLYDTSKKPAFIAQKKIYKDGKLVSDKKLNSDGSARD